MSIIELPLKAQWYDMIESGIKKEEYRELKPYWMKRLLQYWDCWGSKQDMLRLNSLSMLIFAKFDAVRFRYGYTRRTMLWSIEEISIGKGHTEWGAPQEEDVFIIKLKERIE